MLLKDYERERLLEKGEKAYLSDSDEDDGNKHFIEKKKTEELTYNEEQEQLKKRYITRYLFFIIQVKRIYI